MSDPNKVVEAPKRIESMSFENTKNYWTKERKANAEPIKTPLINKSDKVELTKSNQESGKKTVSQDKIVSDKGSDIATDTLLLTNNADYQTERVRDISAYPYSAVGKLFMTFPNGKNYVGSAWTIGESVVFTAGHCVYSAEDGGWAKDIVFSSNDGNRDDKDFVAKTFYSLDGWINEEDFKYDLAVCVMQTPVRPTTGSLGWVAHLPFDNNRVYESIGYPADNSKIKEFDGRFMWKCVGKSHQNNSHNRYEIIGMYNNMTGGCSGGPWVTSYNDQIYANGINSFGYIEDEGKMYSPYFGENFINLINIVKNEMKVEEQVLVEV